MTIIGIAIAAISSGHRFVKSQPGIKTIAKIRVMGKAIEAAIEPSEIYRHIKTTPAQIPLAIDAQTV